MLAEEVKANEVELTKEIQDHGEPLFFKIVSKNEKKAIQTYKQYLEENYEEESPKKQQIITLGGEQLSPEMTIKKSGSICMWDMNDGGSSQAPSPVKEETKKKLPPLKGKIKKPPLVPSVIDNIKRESSLIKKKTKKNGVRGQYLYEDRMKFLRPHDYRKDTASV